MKVEPVMLKGIWGYETSSHSSRQGHWVTIGDSRRFCSKTCLTSMLIRSIFAREKLHERFSASTVFQRKIERINTVARHVLL